MLLSVVLLRSSARATAVAPSRRLLSTRCSSSSCAWVRHARISRSNRPIGSLGRTTASLSNDYHYHATHSQQLPHPSTFRRLLFSSKSDDDNDEQGDITTASRGGIFADTGVTFETMGVKSPILLKRLEKLGLQKPTAVQAAAFESLSTIPRCDVTIGAETGSGKSYAYLLPILDDILQRKHLEKNINEQDNLGYVYARAMILVPNKELVHQVARMAMVLSGGKDSLVEGGVGGAVLDQLPKESTVAPQDMVRIAIMPGGLQETNDFPPFRKAVLGTDEPVDLVISTPAAVGALGLNPKNINMFADIATLVLDEADMLLDGGYIRPLEQVLLGFRRADKLDNMHQVPKTQHVFVAATLPDFGLRSVDAYLQRKFPKATRVTLDGMHNARHYGLSKPTVWLELESKKERLDHFRDLLDKEPAEDGLKGQKIMLFVNSVDDVEGVHLALSQSGIECLPYHAKMTLSDRTQNLDRFRNYDSEVEGNDDAVPILVCTDLASRGVDIPGVHVIVQLQFAGNVVAHLHRMGRCGRAGQRTGRGIVFYNEKERDLVKVVQEAEEQQETMTLKGQDVMELDEEGNVVQPGTVKNAFSRKRGFTKKRKKQRQESE